MLILSRQVDESIVVGRDVVVTPTDIDAGGARVIVRGTMVGGANDGGRFDAVHELAPGASFPVGPMIVVTLVEVRGGFARLGVHAPKSMPVRRKEIADRGAA
jgi:sRNA-binding carbon storage regulator CsrA